MRFSALVSVALHPSARLALKGYLTLHALLRRAISHHNTPSIMSWFSATLQTSIIIDAPPEKVREVVISSPRTSTFHERGKLTHAVS
jgi:hypothetical protein